MPKDIETFGVFKYGDDYKIIWYKTNQDKSAAEDEIIFTAERTNDEKLECNIIRAKSKVKEYALCNEWEYFITLTLNEKKQDRFNLESYHRAFKDWVKGYNRKYNADLKYLTIPEQHDNGAWHMHGFFKGVSIDSLIINEYGHLDMPYYKNRFGWICLDEIRDKTKCANYITKYINKDMQKRVKDVGKHLYYCSRKLKQKEYICTLKGNVNKTVLDTFYQNDYCGVLWCKDMPEWYNDIVRRGIIFDKDTGELYNEKCK